MKKLFLIIVGAMFLLGCGGPKIIYKNLEVSGYKPTGPKVVYTKRIYLMHGLRSTKADFENEPFKSWVDGLKQNNYDIVTFNLPYATEAMFDTDGGAQYKQDFIELMNMVIDAVEAKNGPAAVNIAGGVSWGGLHSLMAVEELDGFFDQYFAYVPVTDLTALFEFESCCSSAHFNPWNDTNALGAIPGYIAWGNMDMRVNYNLTIDLVDEIEDKSRLTTKEWNLGHQSTPQSLQAITEWLEGL